MRQFVLKKFLYLFLSLFVFSSYGNFLSSYVTFDIGDDWTCKFFGINWVCHHYFHKGAKPALILVTAREGNKTDTLKLRSQLLNQQEAFDNKIHATQISIYRHSWLDVLSRNHFTNLFHRKVAAVCCPEDLSKIHVVIIFLAHEENYTKYSSQFLRAINSLELVEDMKEAFKKIRRQTKKQQEEMLSYITNILFMEDDLEAPLNKKKDFPFLRFVFLFLTFLFLGGFYFYYRRRKKKRSRRKRKKRRSKKASHY